MELLKFQEKLDKIHDLMERGVAENQLNAHQYRAFDDILDCLEELSMEISKINNDEKPV